MERRDICLTPECIKINFDQKRTIHTATPPLVQNTRCRRYKNSSKKIHIENQVVEYIVPKSIEVDSIYRSLSTDTNEKMKTFMKKKSNAACRVMNLNYFKIRRGLIRKTNSTSNKFFEEFSFSLRGTHYNKK